MSGLTSDQLATIAFETGLDANGKLNSVNGWRWNDDIPATYGKDDGDGGSAHKWGGGAAGTSGGTVNYYFDSGSKWSTAEQGIFTSTMALWSAEANITCTQVSTPAAATLVFYRYGTTTTPQGVKLEKGSAYSLASYDTGKPGDTTLPATTSDYVAIDTKTDNWSQLASFVARGGEGVGTVVHELGHVIGLAHTGPYNGKAEPKTQQYNATDTKLWSVMSYFYPTNKAAKFYNDYTVTGSDWSAGDFDAEPTTPMMLDILGVQRLYGTPATTPLNNVTFGFKCTIQGVCKPFFNFDVNSTPVITLYATGTNNTFNVSGWSTPSTINLNPGTFSSVDGLKNNIGIAFGTRIDNFIGGKGDDVVTVNADADTIDGGGGKNTVVFSGNYADYTTGWAADGAYTVSKGGITDTLRNVQSVQLAYQTRDVPPPTVASVTASPGSGNATLGRTVTLMLDMSAPVTVSGGVPTLGLNDGGTATYTGGSGTNALTFSYTVAAGEHTTDLTVSDNSFNGAVILDAAGEAAVLWGAIDDPTGLRVSGEAQYLDVSGGGTSDILFRDPNGGGVGAFIMNNGQPTWTALGWADPSLQLVGIGDFNADGTADLAFRDLTGGELGMLAMHTGQPAWTDIGWADPALRVIGTGDFNGDGTADILFRDPTSGNLGDFLMHNGVPSWTSIGWADPSWQSVGTGDFNGDGTADILFRDPTSGNLSMFSMTANQPTWTDIGWADPALRIVGVGDFNGDGTDDILFRDPTSGNLGDFLMSNGQPTWVNIGWVDPSLQVAGIGDYNADGTDDIAFRDPAGGGVSMLAMNNNRPTWTALGWAASTLHAAGQ